MRSAFSRIFPPYSPLLEAGTCVGLITPVAKGLVWVESPLPGPAHRPVGQPPTGPRGPSAPQTAAAPSVEPKYWCLSSPERLRGFAVDPHRSTLRLTPASIGPILQSGAPPPPEVWGCRGEPPCPGPSRSASPSTPAPPPLAAPTARALERRVRLMPSHRQQASGFWCSVNIVSGFLFTLFLKTISWFSSPRYWFCTFDQKFSLIWKWPTNSPGALPPPCGAPPPDPSLPHRGASRRPDVRPGNGIGGGGRGFVPRSAGGGGAKIENDFFNRS